MNKLSKANDILDKSDDRLNKLNDKIIKIKKALNDKTLSDDERNKLQIEIKDLNRKLREEEKNKETIHNQNLVTTRKLQKLMKEKKENKEFYDLFDNLAKNFENDKEKSYLSDCNWTRTHNHLVHKRTLNHLTM